MLLRQTLLYLPAQVLAPLLQFAAILAWAWWLPPVEMGAFTILAAAQELGYLLFLSWFSAYALRYFGDGEGDPDHRRAFHASENLVILTAGGLNFALAAGLVAWFGDLPADVAFIFAAGAFLTARSVNAHMAERARAAQRIGAYTLLQVTGPALGLLMGWIAHGFVHLNAAWALAIHAAAHLAAIAAALPLTGMRPAPLRLAAPVLRKALAYGAPLLLAGGFSWIALNALRYVAEGFQGLAAAGLIAVGLGLGQRGAAFAAMFVTAAAFPLAVKAHREGGEQAGMRQLALGGALLIAALAPAVAGLFAISHDVSMLLVSENYRPVTAMVLPWAIVMGAARNLRSHFPDQVFLLAGRSSTVTLVDGIDAAATVALSIAGIVLAGLPGAVMGAAAAAIIAAVASFALAARQPHFTFPWGHAARATFASGLMLAALALFGPAAHITTLVFKILLGAAIHALGLAALYPRELAAALTSLRTRLA